MKFTYLVLISLLIISCKPTSPNVPEEIEPIKEEIIEAILEDLETSPDYVDKVEQQYEQGRYEKAVEDGAIILSIHPISEAKCRFVFDTRKMSSWAKIAGDLYIDKDGKATYTGNRCEALDFHFTKEGVSVKEFNCDGYHGRKCTFDGFYTKPKKVEEDLTPTTLLKQLETGEKQFEFYASFTEPFWTIYFVGNQIIFSHTEGEPAIYKADQSFNPTFMPSTEKYTALTSNRLSKSISTIAASSMGIKFII